MAGFHVCVAAGPARMDEDTCGSLLAESLEPSAAGQRIWPDCQLRNAAGMTLGGVTEWRQVVLR